MKPPVGRILLRVLALGLALQTAGCALLIAGAAAGGAAGVATSIDNDHQQHYSPMTYAGTVVANVVYCPTKVAFAAVGAATSGVAYVATLGRPKPSNTIWAATVKGDYVMTPRMIEGKDAVHFIGA
ncbi:MAG TPA: hypothetical protein VMW17_00755 [Candidatus Binatia bacterium]|nr:hypothetical protein [Candidatus Binatia bacterium]